MSYGWSNLVKYSKQITGSTDRLRAMVMTFSLNLHLRKSVSWNIQPFNRRLFQTLRKQIWCGNKRKIMPFLFFSLFFLGWILGLAVYKLKGIKGVVTKATKESKASNESRKQRPQKKVSKYKEVSRWETREREGKKESKEMSKLFFHSSTCILWIYFYEQFIFYIIFTLRYSKCYISI